MSALPAPACAEGRADSDQYQDDAGPEQEEAAVVLIGDGAIADEGDRPACSVDVVPPCRERPRVRDRVRIALGVEQELPGGAFGDADDAVHDLLGGLERVASC